MVGITAGCDMVSPTEAAAIGAICGILMIYSVEFIDRTLKIDTPVGAAPYTAYAASWDSSSSRDWTKSTGSAFPNVWKKRGWTSTSMANRPMVHDVFHSNIVL